MWSLEAANSISDTLAMLDQPPVPPSSGHTSPISRASCRRRWRGSCRPSSRAGLAQVRVLPCRRARRSTSARHRADHRRCARPGRAQHLVQRARRPGPGARRRRGCARQLMPMPTITTQPADDGREYATPRRGGAGARLDQDAAQLAARSPSGRSATSARRRARRAGAARAPRRCRPRPRARPARRCSQRHAASRIEKVAPAPGAERQRRPRRPRPAVCSSAASSTGCAAARSCGQQRRALVEAQRSTTRTSTPGNADIRNRQPIHAPDSTCCRESNRRRNPGPGAASNSARVYSCCGPQEHLARPGRTRPRGPSTSPRPGRRPAPRRAGRA